MARIIKQYIRYVPAEVTTFTSMISGLVPASGASSPETKFLRGDATWTTLSSTILSDFTESVQDVVGAQLVAGSNITISYDDSTGQITISASGGGGGISDGDKGDITVSSSGTVWNIDAGAVTTTELGGDITTAGKALLDDADASAQRTTLGLGTAATSNTGDFAAASHSHSASDITSGTKTSAFISDFTEAAQDAIGAMVTSEFTYTDGTPELTINSISNTKISGLGSLATASTINDSNWSGTDLSLANGGTGASLTDPNADRLMFWDDSAGAVDWLTLGTNLSITGTTINASGGGGGLSDADYGDITVSGTGTVMTIDNDVVTYAKIQNVSATDKLLGRVTAGAGDIEEVTFTDFAQSLVDDVDASAARTTLGLGTLATQSGTFSGTSSGTNTGDQTITLTSDVTGSGTGSFATTIAAGAVSLSKMANMATASILGRNTAGTGSPEVLSASTSRTLLSLDTSSTVQFAKLGLGTSVSGSNILEVRGAQSIFDNPSGSVAVTYNKQLNTNDAMFYFTTGYSTRAIIGTQGSDDLTIKTSPDGAAFNTAAVFNRTTGKCDFNVVPSVGGTNLPTSTFSTIAISGQSDVVADSPTDTLTLVAGTNITLTTNDTSDTITITAASGSGAFDPGMTLVMSNNNFCL